MLRKPILIPTHNQINVYSICLQLYFFTFKTQMHLEFNFSSIDLYFSTALIYFIMLILKLL